MKKGIFLIACTLVTSLLFSIFMPGKIVSAVSETKSVTLSGTNQTQSGSITLPENTYKLDSVTTSNGAISYTKSGNTVNYTVSNGTGVSSVYYDDKAYSVYLYITGRGWDSDGAASGAYTSYPPSTYSYSQKPSNIYGDTGISSGGYLRDYYYNVNCGNFSGTMIKVPDAACGEYYTGTLTLVSVQKSVGNDGVTYYYPIYAGTVYAGGYVGTKVYDANAYSAYLYITGRGWDSDGAASGAYTSYPPSTYFYSQEPSDIYGDTGISSGGYLRDYYYNVNCGCWNGGKVKVPDASCGEYYTGTLTLVSVQKSVGNDGVTYYYPIYAGTVYAGGYVATTVYNYTVTATYETDATPPTGHYSLSKSAWTCNPVTITVEATDSESGVASITEPNGTVILGSAASYVVTENGTYNFMLADNVGNSCTYPVTVSNIDRVMSVTHPLSVSYTFDPNTGMVTAQDISIVNNSPHIGVKVTLQSLKSTGMNDVAPDKYVDWSKLTAAQSESDTAFGVAVKEQSPAEGGWTSISTTGTLYATNIASPVQLGILNTGGTGNLTIDAKFGLAWNSGKTVTQDLALLFDACDVN